MSSRAQRARVDRDIAELELRVAERTFDGSLDAVERRLRARFALDCAASELDAALVEVVQASLKRSEGLSRYGEEVLLVKQAAAGFVEQRAFDDKSGWTWPVTIMQAGWAHGTVEGFEGQAHYFPVNVVAQVAEAANGARFRRNHPRSGGGFDEPELTCGWLANCRLEESAAVGEVHLLRDNSEMRPLLLAARESGKMGLFGVSIEGMFGYKRSTVDDKPALVATHLLRLFGIDFVAEPGAGGRFLG